MRDAILEFFIERAYQDLVSANTPERQKRAVNKMKNLIAKRSKKKVDKMEKPIFMPHTR